MAEYYPLLVRAVAGLADSTPETRRAIYERARSALLGQLRAVQPPVPEDNIQRESRSLDEAIRRIEDEIAARPPAEPAKPSVDARPAPPPRPAAVKPPEPLARRPDLGAMARPPAQPRAGLPPRPAMPPRPGMASTERPGVNGIDAARSRTQAPPKPWPAAPDDKPAPRPVVGADPAPETSKLPPEASKAPPEAPKPAAEPAKTHSEPVRQAESAAVEAPPLAPNTPFQEDHAPGRGGSLDSALGAPGGGPTDAPRDGRPAPDLRAERPERRSAEPRPVNVTLRKFGPRAEAAGTADQAGLAGPEPVEEAPLSRGVVRPAAPQRREEKPRNMRPWLIGVPVALVVAGIAVFAYIRRDDPEELARMKPAATETAQDAGAGKIVERIGGGQSARAPDSPSGAASQPGAPAGDQTAANSATSTTAPTSANPAIPVAQRAALLVDAPNEPQKVKTFVGNVVWRLENVSRGPGQPLTIGVRAEVDLPDAQMKAVMLIQKNTDETLPASHTIEVRFTPTEGGPIPGVAQISTPQMRKEDTPAGDPLTGVPTPIMQNFFLVGLTRGDTAVARNIDLMKTRAWFDIPMLLSDQRIAKITFEKGSSGERVLNEALEAWQR